MKQYTSLYFVGAGGIGMSALVRYFLAKGYKVAGYDRTQSPLTTELKAEGLEIVYEESVESIPDYCRNPETTLVVYTPAIPASHVGLVYFREHGFRVVKRAELLGLITQSSKGLCFAGTHGKTTTSSMAAHIFHESPIGCNAFLGGILRNYNSNLILSEQSPFTVIEADEYDRYGNRSRSFGYLRNRGGLFGEFRSFHFVDTAGWLFDYEERYQAGSQRKGECKNIYLFGS